MALPLPSSDPRPLAPGIHSTDAFHRRPLLAVHPAARDGHPVLVRSWSEAYALHGPAVLGDVNPAYVAALIRRRHAADLAPYRRIHRLPRAHHVLLEVDGRWRSSPYDPFGSGAGPMQAEELDAFLRQGLIDQLRQALAGTDAPVGCEHSSGLDSNAVVGALRHGIGVPASDLHTWSMEAAGEGPLLQEFRLFHGLLASHCHRSEAEACRRDDENRLRDQLRVFGAPAQLGGNPQACSLLARVGCRHLFSGFGGDQAISHNANNVPTDLVAQRRWRDLVAWVGGRRRALRIGLGRTLALLHRPWAEARVWSQTRDLANSALLERTLTEEGRACLGPHLRDNYPWELDGYLGLADSIRCRTLADWVAVRMEDETRMAAAHALTMVFPLLDERWIGTLLRQDPLLFGERQMRGRLIHRRAFAPYLPPFLQHNPTKARAQGEALKAFQEQIREQRSNGVAALLGQADRWHPALGRWWDLPAIRDEAQASLDNADGPWQLVHGTHDALTTLTALSLWWHALDD